MFDLDELARADDALNAIASGSRGAPTPIRKPAPAAKPAQCPFQDQHREHAA
jgi:hypothetical protein